MERFLGLAHHHVTPYIELNVLSHMNADLAQPRNRSNVARPFSSCTQRVGSRDETRSVTAYIHT